MCGDGKEKWKDSGILEVIKFGRDIEKQMKGEGIRLLLMFWIGGFLGFTFAMVVFS